MFEIRQRLSGLCFIGNIVPQHCTTMTILKAILSENLCMALEVLDQSRYSEDCN